MKLLKKISTAIYGLVVGLLVLIASVTAFSVLRGPGGFRFFVVQSGSMEPAVKTGSVVLVVPRKEYKAEDIITFLANPKADLKDIKATVTHRIVSVHDDEGRATFKTKGDANQTEDREMVTIGQVLGKVMLNIPFLGYAVAFTKTRTGFITLIIIPGTLIVYSELLNIKKELIRLIKEWKKKKKKPAEKPKKQ